MKSKASLIAAAVAGVALCAPALASGQQPGYRLITDTLGGNGRIDVAAATSPDVRETDPRARGPVEQPNGYRFITDTLGGNGNSASRCHSWPCGFGAATAAVARERATRATAVSGNVAKTSGGFDWADAGIGASAALALVAFLAASLALTRQLRRRPQAA